MTGAHRNSTIVKQHFVKLEVTAWSLGVEEDSVQSGIYLSRAISAGVKEPQGVEAVAQRSAPDWLGGSTV
jgi:hypothetical protein